MKSNKLIIKVICIIILLIFFIQNVDAQSEEKTTKKWFTKVIDLFKSLFGIENEYEKNLKLCEEFRGKMCDVP